MRDLFKGHVVEGEGTDWREILFQLVMSLGKPEVCPTCANQFTHKNWCQLEAARVALGMPPWDEVS